MLERKAWTVRALGRYDQSIALLDEVIDRFAALGENEKAAELCREMGYMFLWLGRFEDVFATNQRGLDILGDRAVPARAYLVSGIGALLGVGGFLDQALPYIEQGDEIGEELADERVLGWTAWTRCVAIYSDAQMDPSIEVGSRATELLRRSGDLWTLCDSLSWTALAMNLAGRVSEAAVVGGEALGLSQRLGHVGGEILSNRAVLASQVLTDPDLERWEERVRRDLVLCESIRSPWVSQGHVWLAVALMHRGRLDEARAHLDTALELEPVSAFGGLAEAYGIMHFAYADDRDGFVAAFEAARPRLPGGPAATPWGSLLVPWCALQGAALLGMKEIAAEVDPHIQARASATPIGFFDGGLASRMRGTSAALDERWDEAEEELTLASRQVVEFPNVLDRPKVAHWHGKMLLDRGRPEDRDRARAMIESALDDYRAFGMAILATVAEELLEYADR